MAPCVLCLITSLKVGRRWSESPIPELNAIQGMASGNVGLLQKRWKRAQARSCHRHPWSLVDTTNDLATTFADLFPK